MNRLNAATDDLSYKQLTVDSKYAKQKFTADYLTNLSCVSIRSRLFPFLRVLYLLRMLFNSYSVDLVFVFAIPKDQKLYKKASAFHDSPPYF